MGKQTTEPTPGLKSRRRSNGATAYYWVAADPDFPIRTFPLNGVTLANIPARCQQLQYEMITWRSGRPKGVPVFDGTIGGMMKVYRSHPNSPYHKLKPSSLCPYVYYIDQIERSLGSTKIAGLNGLDVLRWHDAWRAPRSPGGRETLGAAHMALSVLKAALSFGVFCGVAECKTLADILCAGKFPKPKPRTEAPEAAQVVAVRAAAHALGLHSVAFAVALQFEGAIRQWDVIGQWVPIDDPRPSFILAHGKKWIGPTWASIDKNMILSITPTKTEKSSGARVRIDLSKCPMVLEEIALIPPHRRSGPLIVAEKSCLPYTIGNYPRRWRQCANRVGIPKSMWNRDLRAGGITEGSKGGARLDDLAKQAGHASNRTTAHVYDRDKLEASRRVADARKIFRENLRMII